MGKTVQILIVDNHPLIRDGLKARLSSQSDWSVCGEAETAEEALAFARRLAPEIAIVDLSLRQGSGLELIKQLVALPSAPRILVCSMHDENLYAQRALQAGASGFLHKQHAAQNLIVAIQRILDGKIYVSEPIAERMLQQAAGASSSMSPIETLTDRELSVFELTGRGFTIQQIADSCHLSAKTVETYRERAKGKLGLRTSAEFLRHAVKWVTEHAGE